MKSYKPIHKSVPSTVFNVVDYFPWYVLVSIQDSKYFLFFFIQSTSTESSHILLSFM